MSSNNKSLLKWIIMIVFSLLLLIIVWLFVSTKYSLIPISDKPNEIGDAIGGITSPIIGIGGVTLTFLAFYIQYKFNIEQSNLIQLQRLERDEDKIEKSKELYNERIDKKVNEYSNYLERLTYISGEINTAVIFISDVTSDLFSMIDTSSNFVFSLEDDSIELVFIKMSKSNLDFYHKKIKNSNEESYNGIGSLNKEYLSEQIAQQIHVYFKFCKFLNLFRLDLEKSNISDDDIQSSMNIFLRKFEFCYPMNSMKMSTIFIIYFTLQFNEDKMKKYILEYHSSISNFDKILEILEHALKVYKK